MPRLILKVRRDPADDLYCVWSTIVDSATYVGTASECLECEALGRYPEGGDPQRIERAKQAGTSSLSPNGVGCWSSQTLWTDNGYIPREGLYDYLVGQGLIEVAEP